MFTMPMKISESKISENKFYDDYVADLEQKSQMQSSSIKFAEILDKSELEVDDSRDVVSLGHARNHRASRLDDFLENPMSQRVNLLDS